MKDNTSYLSNTSPEIIEQYYKIYQESPESLENSWKHFFQGFELGSKDYPKLPGQLLSGEFNILNLIYDYRSRGHLFTEINPVRTRKKHYPDLNIEHFGLTERDLDKQYSAGETIGIGKAKLSEIIAYLQETYCKNIGVEYMYIRNPEIVNWLKQQMEPVRNQPSFSVQKKKEILNQLAEAVFFEKFIHKRFAGHKRFSLEGAEILIPALHNIISGCINKDVQKVIIGMPHRGRLNVLANIMQKPVSDIFNEFEGKEYDDWHMLGDVKYHLGYTSVKKIPGNHEFEISLCPNPSHLEAVNPVVEGISRALTDIELNKDFSKIIPVVIHGDAAFAGQGVVYEVIQMSQLEGYKTGGTIHIIVNNQIGFTTNIQDARSSIYCTDVAKTIQSPIFHVNADDAEAVIFICELSLEFRQRFGRDVFIDLQCYRRYGHNESDEPRFTQPLLYKTIEKHPDIFSIYKKELENQFVFSPTEASSLIESINERLEVSYKKSKTESVSHISPFLEKYWKDLSHEFNPVVEATNCEENILEQVADKLTQLPDGKKLFGKMEKILTDRRYRFFNEKLVDWAFAELLALGSLVKEGYTVRLSGQDVKRGTFSQRHAVLTIEDSEEDYNPFDKLCGNESRFYCYNSLLSEYGVLGFDYGYSLISPKILSIWEAQFGDFSNGAQIIFDQFISSAEEKWGVKSSLTILLPHGYEGQGPEHSSGRMERVLILCADNNIQVANCTTPANYFHLLRRQIKSNFRKPLIVFTPKSLLRHPSCISPVKDLTDGCFKKVLEEESNNPERIKRIVFCNGKIFYDLSKEKSEKEYYETAIIRIEQLYPFPIDEIRNILNKYPKATQYIWVQEEPANMGTWAFVKRHFHLVPLMLVARPESGSPATGSAKLHHIRQRKIIEKAFAECNCQRKEEECKMICAPKEFNFFPTQTDAS